MMHDNSFMQDLIQTCSATAATFTLEEAEAYGKDEEEEDEVEEPPPPPAGVAVGKKKAMKPRIKGKGS
jgi:hypothetical protein